MLLLRSSFRRHTLRMLRARCCSTKGGRDSTPPPAADDWMSRPNEASTPASSASLWMRSVESDGATLGKPLVTASTPNQVEEIFYRSVLARTTSNAQLRRYVQHLEPKDYALALAAVQGAQAAGLRIDPKSNEVLLNKLMEGGQLKASMELYQKMIANRVTPTANTYATLMQMCLERDLPEGCQRFFEEMVQRGVSPNTENYELYITSLSLENPPKWGKAVEIFDQISRERHCKHLTATTYNALMRVYLNMKPFDWRIVYNCYHELRTREPPIPLQWESYKLVAEALRRGRAGYIRRFLTYLDAWFCVTHFRTWDFLIGVTLYLGAMFILKGLISWLVVWYYERVVSAGRGAAESMIP